jgi:hypothetical protein
VTLHRLGQTYGSTFYERHAPMPGDGIVPKPRFVIIHGITNSAETSAGVRAEVPSIGVEMLLLILPAAGAVSSEPLPNRNTIDGMACRGAGDNGGDQRHGEERLSPPSGPGFMSKVFSAAGARHDREQELNAIFGPISQAANQQH